MLSSFPSDLLRKYGLSRDFKLRWVTRVAPNPICLASLGKKGDLDTDRDKEETSGEAVLIEWSIYKLRSWNLGLEQIRPGRPLKKPTDQGLEFLAYRTWNNKVLLLHPLCGTLLWQPSRLIYTLSWLRITRLCPPQSYLLSRPHHNSNGFCPKHPGFGIHAIGTWLCDWETPATSLGLKGFSWEMGITYIYQYKMMDSCRCEGSLM